MSPQTHLSRSSSYAPKPPNPIRLAGATVQAVDQIGLETSKQIEMTADEIMRGATEVADQLRILADAVREQTKIASEQLAGFCDRATSVLDGLRDIQDKLLTNGHEAKVDESDDTLSVPVFIMKGPSLQNQDV